MVGLLCIARGIRERSVPRYSLMERVVRRVFDHDEKQMAIIILVAVVAAMAWAAYAHFMHSTPLPNFHWSELTPLVSERA